MIEGNQGNGEIINKQPKGTRVRAYRLQPPQITSGRDVVAGRNWKKSSQLARKLGNELKYNTVSKSCDSISWPGCPYEHR